jgi:hypothetical protein
MRKRFDIECFPQAGVIEENDLVGRVNDPDKKSRPTAGPASHLGYLFDALYAALLGERG